MAMPYPVEITGGLYFGEGHGVKQAIAAAGAVLLYLPPYSPDLNPIEKLFAKLKALLRKRPNDLSKHYGTRSANCSTPFPQPNAQTTSPLLDMYALKLEML